MGVVEDQDDRRASFLSIGTDRLFEQRLERAHQGIQPRKPVPRRRDGAILAMPSEVLELLSDRLADVTSVAAEIARLDDADEIGKRGNGPHELGHRSKPALPPLDAHENRRDARRQLRLEVIDHRGSQRHHLLACGGEPDPLESRISPGF